MPSPYIIIVCICHVVHNGEKHNCMQTSHKRLLQAHNECWQWIPIKIKVVQNVSSTTMYTYISSNVLLLHVHNVNAMEIILYIRICRFNELFSESYKDCYVHTLDLPQNQFDFQDVGKFEVAHSQIDLPQQNLER